ncbi:MAG: nucleoside deaminase [Chloroflexaceae bacterium]|nr:nucleoside deaminase [Chloroflexaceae bacterium]
MNEAQHTWYMEQCLRLAEAARQAENLGVGALVVAAERIVATGQETLPQTLDVTGHAEIIALRGACQTLGTLNLSGCTLYTTAEPCWMCSYAIRETQIRMVVIGVETTDVGGISTRYPLLVDSSIEGWGAPPDIVTGVLREACATLRESSLA